MSNEKVKINRAPRRKNKRNKGISSRQIIVGGIVVGALLIAFAFIKPSMDSIPSASDVIIPTTVARPSADGLTIGDPSAPARIDVFEDFQCPACKSFTEEVEHRILTELVTTGKAYYVFHNYAFLDRSSATKESHQAAIASLCANEQGRFWDYHDTLFANWNGENQGAFNNNHLVNFATALKLDVNAFKTCLSEGRYADEVQASFDKGNSMGVQGTPSVFVNEKIVKVGVVPTYEEIAAAVDAAQP